MPLEKDQTTCNWSRMKRLAIRVGSNCLHLRASTKRRAIRIGSVFHGGGTRTEPRNIYLLITVLYCIHTIFLNISRTNGATAEQCDDIEKKSRSRSTQRDQDQHQGRGQDRYHDQDKDRDEDQDRESISQLRSRSRWRIKIENQERESTSKIKERRQNPE